MDEGSNDQTPTPVEPVRRRASRSMALVATGVAAGVALAGFGVAAAQGGDGTPKPTEQAAEGRPHLGRFRGGPGGPGLLGRMLHGEGVVQVGEDGSELKTVAVQSGTVESASDASITVRSSDGFTRTYAVDAETKVLPKANDIADIDEGDTVKVHATVDGDTATIEHIVDVSDMPQRPGRRVGPPAELPDPAA